MALPLKVGERIIGALDVQSAQEAAFGEEDVATLQIMADQLAMAIERTRLFEQTQAALEERLNAVAAVEGELRLTIPMLYLEAQSG